MKIDAFKRIAAVAAVCGTLVAEAEVFTLWPWKPGATDEVRRRLETLPGLSAETLFSEKLEINGVPLTLETYRADGRFSDLLRFLTTHFPAENLQVIGDTIRLTYQLPDGWLDRWLLIGSGPDRPVTVFRISAPEKLPRAEWPHELPSLPTGAVPVQVIHFARRGGWYGSFENAPDDPSGNLRQTVSELRSDGWIAAANESAIGGNGDIFLQPNGRGVAWICYTGTRGAFYVNCR